MFVLTSHYESYGFILLEAARYNNYLTKVGAFSVLTNCGEQGASLPMNDSDSLAAILQNIIDGNTNVDMDDKPKYWKNWDECINVL